MIVLSIVVALGVQCSTKFSAVFVFINVLILTMITVCGFIYGNLENWNKDGTSSFFPFGWHGTLQATATCFWAFVGFETISCAVEETENPKRNIPVSMALATLIVVLLYVGASASLTLMAPLSSIDSTTSMSSVFVHTNLIWGQFVVSIGIICGFTTAILSCTYTFVRIAHAIAEDGLLFQWFARVNPCSKISIWSVICCGSIQAVVSFCLDIKDLLEFSVNFILISYASVCICLIILSYHQPSSDRYNILSNKIEFIKTHVEDSSTDLKAESETQTFQLKNSSELENSDEEYKKLPDESCDDVSTQFCQVKENVNQKEISGKHPCREFHLKGFVPVCVVMMMLFIFIMTFDIIYAARSLEKGEWWSVTLLLVSLIGIVASIGTICIHRQIGSQAVLKVIIIQVLLLFFYIYIYTYYSAI